MYQIYYINFDYRPNELFDTIDNAIAYGISKGFEFKVNQYGKDSIIAVWSPISGLQRYN